MNGLICRQSSPPSPGRRWRPPSPAGGRGSEPRCPSPERPHPARSHPSTTALTRPALSRPPPPSPSPNRPHPSHTALTRPALTRSPLAPTLSHTGGRGSEAGPRTSPRSMGCLPVKICLACTRINLEILSRFEAAGISLAVPLKLDIRSDFGTPGNRPDVGPGDLTQHPPPGSYAPDGVRFPAYPSQPGPGRFSTTWLMGCPASSAWN